MHIIGKASGRQSFPLLDAYTTLHGDGIACKSLSAFQVWQTRCNLSCSRHNSLHLLYNRTDSTTRVSNMPVLKPIVSGSKSMWRAFYEWNDSFKLDALGLITLLGAEEVGNAPGQLTRSTWCQYLPIMASNIVAADKFRNPIPGYGLGSSPDISVAGLPGGCKLSNLAIINRSFE